MFQKYLPGSYSVTEDSSSEYTTDPKLPLEREKILPMSLTSAISINALLKKDLNLLEVKRIGGDRNKNTLSRLSNQARRK